MKYKDNWRTPPAAQNYCAMPLLASLLYKSRLIISNCHYYTSIHLPAAPQPPLCFTTHNFWQIDQYVLATVTCLSPKTLKTHDYHLGN